MNLAIVIPIIVFCLSSLFLIFNNQIWNFIDCMLLKYNKYQYLRKYNKKQRLKALKESKDNSNFKVYKS
ncbi:hypothetical protein ACTOJ1_000932 [Shigella flexneri]